MDVKCKDCEYENKCACFDCSRLDRKDRFEPKAVEIRPEGEREVWTHKVPSSVHVLITGWTELGGGKLVFRNADGDVAPIELGIVHNKNGWTRLYPPVEESMKEYADRVLKNMEDDSIERIEIEGVVWKAEVGIGHTTYHPILNHALCRDVHEDLLSRPPMKMILEIPKDKP